MEERINRIEQNKTLSNIMNNVCEVYCKDLDNYMDLIDSTLSHSKINEIPTQDIEEWILNITSILYFTISGLEEVGIKEDMCKAIRQEMYTKAHSNSVGTVAERQNQALLGVKEEDLVLQVYTRAYKKIKQKVDAGYEMLNSMKKVMSARITDNELSNSRYATKDIGGR